MSADVHKLDGSVVLPIGTPNLRDISGMMRRVADQIDAGEHGDLKCAGLVLLQRDMCEPLGVFGWGDINTLEFYGLLQLAAHRIVSPVGDEE